MVRPEWHRPEWHIQSGDTKDLLEFLEMQKETTERAFAVARKQVKVGVAAPLDEKMAEARLAKPTFELMKLKRLLRAGNSPFPP